MSQPRLTLVGAGPGDPDLITIKGIKALADADVVLYDALAHPDLLKHAPLKARKVFVGKRKGACKYTQDQINKLIVEYAKQYGHVVRLKGGDPFVFGRGHEELEYAKNFDVPTEVVPGISSSFSVPELQHIPLTKRNYTESFWVITGTTRNHELSADVYQAAQSDATAIILMGMSNLSQIVTIYKDVGKADLPVAIIQNGSLENEKIGLGTVATIEQVVEENKLSNPAIIMLGEVVSLHPEYLPAIVEKLSV